MNLLIIIIGTLFVIYGVWSLYKIKSLSAWVEVPCDIVSFGIKEKNEPALYMRLIYYVPVFEYGYKIGRCNYKGKGVAYSDAVVKFESMSAIKKYIDEVKKRSTVFVDPKNYERSIINRSIPNKIYHHYMVMILVGIIILAFGFFLMWL